MIIPTLRHGTWQDHVSVDADDAMPIDPDADALQLAMLGINPATAELLLRNFVDLSPGSWVGQTAGNSAVGRYVIALAKNAGLRTISVVRRPEAVHDLLESGADVVLVSGPQLGDELRQVLGDERLALLIDAVAGDVVTELASWLVQGGTLVSYGGMSGAAVIVKPQDLIFREVQVRGFWQKHWLDKAPREEVRGTYARLASLVANGVLRAPIAATYSLDQYEVALASASQTGGAGKVLFAW